jgi:hypothetical protein
MKSAKSSKKLGYEFCDRMIGLATEVSQTTWTNAAWFKYNGRQVTNLRRMERRCNNNVFALKSPIYFSLILTRLKQLSLYSVKW